MSSIKRLLNCTVAFVMWLPAITRGAGLVAIKDQPFHNDDGATVVVFVSLKHPEGPMVMIKTATTEFTVERQKVVGILEQLPLPAHLTTETEIASIRESLAKMLAFVVRFPKSQPILNGRITTLEKICETFSGGKVLTNGQWILRQQFDDSRRKEEERLAVLQKEREQTVEAKKLAAQEQKAIAARSAEATAKQVESQQESDRAKRDAEAFAKSQWMKGLREFEGKWIPIEEAQTLRKRKTFSRVMAGNKKEINFTEVRKWEIPAGGFGRVIVISPINANFEDLTILTHNLMDLTKGDSHASAFVYTSTEAANFHAQFNSMTPEERAMRSKAFVGNYSKNPLNQHNESCITPEGLDGPYLTIRESDFREPAIHHAQE